MTIRTGNFGGGGTAVATSDDPPTEGEDEEEDQEGVGHRSSTPVLRCRGGGKLRFRVFQKRRPRDALERRSARQDVVVSLGGGGYPSTSTRFLRRIADAMTRKGPVEGGDDDDGADNNDFFVDALCDDENDDDDDDDDRRGAAPEEEEEGGKGGRPGTTTTTTGVPEYVLTDEFSREAYDRIMRQYTEARHYARAAGGRTNPVVRRQARRRRRRPFQPERRRCRRRRWRRHLVRRVLRRERPLGRLLLLDRGRWGGHTGRGGGRTLEGQGGRWSPRHDGSGGGSDYGDD